MSKKIFLLDGHSLAHRAFYALPLLTNSEGEYTNSVFGFSRMLFKLIDEYDPAYITVAFDTKAKTFRHDVYEEYKATRKKMPEELSPQIVLIKRLLSGLNIPIFEIDGYEADDVIGTLAREAEQADMEVVIITGDRDALQLVTENVSVWYTKKGITNLEKYDLNKVKKEYELSPEQLVDRKGLMGDNSDNIPGVPGIGPKTSQKLLKEFGNMENVLDNIDSVGGKKRKENLRKYSEQARMSKELGKIDVNVPIDIELNDCQKEEPDYENLIDLLKTLEFKSLLERFQSKEDRAVLSEEIEITHVKNKEIHELINKIKTNGVFSFSFLFDNPDHPVRSGVEKMIISTDDRDIFVIDVEDIKEFYPLFADGNINKYIINSKECIIYLNNKNVRLNGLDFDPLLAIYLLNPSDSLPDFENMIADILDLVVSEDMDLIEKIGFFTASVFKLADKLKAKMEERGILSLYNNIEIPVVYSLAEMECNGIKVDKDYLEDLSDKWENELNTLTKKVHKIAGREFNLNSPKQLSEILFDELGLPVVKKTKTGYSTDAEVLDELEDKHEIITYIKEYRQLQKLKSTYLDALPPLINPETGKLHTNFNQMVTATGRLSSTEPNLQNIPIRTKKGREIRKAFVPSQKDWVLLAADYSQVELRVLAHISGDKGLKEAFKLEEDIHTRTAAEVFDVEENNVDSELRRRAKVINFGIAYGMSAYGLAEDLDISRGEAEKYISKYFERFPDVKRYMDESVEAARDKGYVTTEFNRRRYIPQIKSRNYHRRSFAERTAINTPIQGTAADIMKKAMIDVYKWLETENVEANLLLQVHDELVLELPECNLNKIAGIVKEKMESTVELNVPLVVDLQYGKNWRDKKEFSEGQKNA